MTLTTTQLAGMSDEQLIELASTDLEREVVRRLDAALDNADKANSRLTDMDEVAGLDEALNDLDAFDAALEMARKARVRLKTFIESL